MGSNTNPFKAMKKASFDAPEEVVEERAEVDATEAVDPNAVPDGTAKEVMDWVGDDEDRAQQALDAEEAKGEDGRKGLKRDLSAKLEN
mgnify:CR=1 FL=1